MRRIRKNDSVIIIAGKDRGKTGRVTQVLADKDKVIVEQANLVKKHQKPNQKNQTGGIVDKEAPIHISNVMLLDGKSGKGTRFRVQVQDGKKSDTVRVGVKSGTVFD
ncbi:MAG: 50S ribosomal protein L24 [Myxococcota bacterium]|jgi:large subunit ribosomal protein L24|nr:50S ribosomal protein L24 [Myxococcota bacterium]